MVARLTGFASTQFHEQIGYSSPIVFNDRVYVGVADHCDNPIQKGRVVAVHLATGAIDAGFNYCSTGTCADSTRGGGVWSSVAAWDDSVYVTTGNVKSGQGFDPRPHAATAADDRRVQDRLVHAEAVRADRPQPVLVRQRPDPGT